MIKYFSSYALVLSGFTHLFCCGVPFFISLSSLTSNLFYYELHFVDFELLEITEHYLLALTSLIFFFLILSEVYSKKIKCDKDDDCCTEEQCDSKQKTFKLNIVLSASLYIVNISFFLTGKIL